MPPTRFQANKASAGSGKTFRLTSAYLRVLLSGAPPETILATTFTRKAAGEVLERVLRRLAEAALSDEAASLLAGQIGLDSLSAAQARGYLKILAKNLHRAQILTIDSFFSRLLKTFRYESGLALGASPIDDNSVDAAEMRVDAIEKIIDSLDSDDVARFLLCREPGKAPSQVIDAIEELAHDYYDLFRSAPKDAWDQVSVPPAPEEAEIAAALAAVQNLADSYGKQLQNGILPPIQCAKDGRWYDFLEKGVPNRISIGDFTYYNKPLDDSLVRAFGPLITKAKSELLSDLKKRNQAIYAILKSFDVVYSQARARRNVMLFSDAPLALEKIFSKSIDAVERLESQIDHLLLDEFQDTSPAQWSVILPFAKRIEAKRDRGSIFCVGDVKQAIYGWRGGSAQIFDEFLNSISGITCENSDCSYRSSQTVLDAVNKLFGSLDKNAAFTDADDLKSVEKWISEFHPHRQAIEKRISGYAELIETNPKSDADADDADFGADEQQGEQNFGHIKICAEKIAEVAKQRPLDSIGALVRANKMVAPLLLALGKLGVYASAESASMLSDDPAVNLILSALTLADHPSDQASAFHVFSSPMATILHLDSTSPAALAQLSRRMRRRLIDEGYPAVIGDWAARLAKQTTRRSAQRLEQLIALAEEHGKNAGLRPSKFVKLALSESQEDPSPSCVRVMTIHKSKGLEFDIVFLPDLNSQIAGGRHPKILVDRPVPTQPARAIYCFPTPAQTQLDPAIARCAKLSRSENLVEALCVLYVAMTRAKSALYMMTVTPKIKKDGSPRKSLAFADILRFGLCDSEWTPPDEHVLSRSLASFGTPYWPSENSSAPPQTEENEEIPPQPPGLAAPVRRTLTRVLPSDAEGGGYVDASSLLSIADDEGARQGTAIHAMINTIEWPDESQASESELLHIALSFAKGSEQQKAKWAEDRLNELKAMLEAPAVSFELKKPAGDAELWREKRFSVVASKNNLLEGAFDRVVLERKNGKTARATILDFKTDSLATSSLAQKTDVYRPQMALYKEALQAMLGIDENLIRAKLLFLRSGDVVEV